MDTVSVIDVAAGAVTSTVLVGGKPNEMAPNGDLTAKIASAENLRRIRVAAVNPSA